MFVVEKYEPGTHLNVISPWTAIHGDPFLVCSAFCGDLNGGANEEPFRGSTTAVHYNTANGEIRQFPLKKGVIGDFALPDEIAN